MEAVKFQQYFFRVIRQVERNREPVVVTKDGVPCGIIEAVSPAQRRLGEVIPPNQT
jgi:hypothetical protein